MTKEDILEQLIGFTNEKGYMPELDELATSQNQEIQVFDGIVGSSDELCVYYYEQLIDEYIISTSSIPELNQLSFGEGFAHFIFTCFELAQEHPTFSKIALQVIESGIFKDSLIKLQLHSLFDSFIRQDQNISAASQLILGDVVYNQFVRDWEEFMFLGFKEEITIDQWTERVDKYSKLIDSILHNDIADKSFDYLKTLYQQGVFSFKRFI